MGGTSSIGSVTIIGVIIAVIISFLPIIPVQYQEEYEVDTPYTITEEVTKTKKVVNHSFDVKAISILRKDFEIVDSHTVDIQWLSTQNITMFSVMSQETWDSLYQTLILELGIAAVTILLSEGTLSAAVIASIPVLLQETMTIIAADEYCRFNTNDDTYSKNLDNGMYKVVIVNLGAAGTLDAILTYDYTVMETRTEYRTEIKLRDSTKYINLWQFVFKLY